MAMVKLEMTCGTDPGRVRSRNEDHVRIIPHLGLAILADGMGGHRAGDVASQIAVDTIGEQWDRKYTDQSTGQSMTITGSRRSTQALKTRCRKIGSLPTRRIVKSVTALYSKSARVRLRSELVSSPNSK